MHDIIKRYQHARFVSRHYLTLENVVLVLAVLIAASLLWSTMVALQRNFMYEQQLLTLEQEVELAQLEAQSLDYSKRYYASAEYQELSARQSLGKALPGEKLIILPPYDASVTQAAQNPGGSTSQTTVAASGVRERTNFEQWLYFFFGESR